MFLSPPTSMWTIYILPPIVSSLKRPASNRLKCHRGICEVIKCPPVQERPNWWGYSCYAKKSFTWSRLRPVHLLISRLPVLQLYSIVFFSGHTRKEKKLPYRALLCSQQWERGEGLREEGGFVSNTIFQKGLYYLASERSCPRVSHCKYLLKKAVQAAEI